MNSLARSRTPVRYDARVQIYNNFDLAKWIVRFGKERSYLTLGDACENVMVVGGMGSSKSTSSLFMIGQALFEAGCGGFGFGVKYGARDETFAMARDAGRGDDVIMFYPGSGQRFNWIDYESKVHGPGNAIVDNLMDVFVSSTEVISRKMGQSQSEPFWEHSWRQMLKHFLFVDFHAHGGIDFLRVLQMCQTLPQSEADLENWRRFASLVALEAATRNCPASQRRSLQLATDYLTVEMPRLSDRTRSCIQQMCSAMLDPHVRDLYQDAFGGTSTWTPDDVMDRGKIVIVGYDVERFGVMGQVINCIVKKCAQRAIGRRREKFGSNMNACRPVAFVMDEAPFLVDSQDERFLRVGRENRAINLWAIQTIPSMVDELGGGEVARNRVDGLLGHFHTKIMHQNNCDITNHKLSEIISKDIWWRLSTNINQNPNGATEGWAWNQQVDYVLPPIAYKQLARGGPKFKWDVRAIVTMPAHKWADGKWWQGIKFVQNCEPHKDHLFFQCLFDHSPVSMWLDQIPTARIWVRHRPFLQLLRDLWKKPKAAKWLFLRWFAFWVGVEGCYGVYKECEKEIDNA
ncbi:MAG TPA: hypothetical protein VN841_07000 [Bryobacteraceae bacterium]|nr:hypothetical protein [Bryobacteraceae bacterium]